MIRTVDPWSAVFVQTYLDIYNIPIRLYQGILHNNPINIGLKMNQVYLPKLAISCVDGEGAPMVEGSNRYNKQINESSLMKYLGLSGLGTWIPVTGGSKTGTIRRSINAIPALAYYDIFKNYYSNKQEENAYVITPGTISQAVTKCSYAMIEGDENTPEIYKINAEHTENNISGDLKTCKLTLYPRNEDYRQLNITLGQYIDEEWIYDEQTLEEWINQGIIIPLDNVGVGNFRNIYALKYENLSQDQPTKQKFGINNVEVEGVYASSGITLTPFKLANIDEMRNRLLSANTLGQEFTIDDQTDLMPYSALVSKTEEDLSWNAFPDNGLVVKTYQSDLFNNWLDSEIIEGENGISELSKVAVEDGAFTIDSLNFAQKIYEVLNRIAVSGGTYEDWQEASYGEGAIRKAETPMYVGGMAAEVMFEEVISSSETNVNEDFQPLGSLGGKGTQVGQKGGRNIHVRCEEPCYIMGIVSLTPRITYSQGNDWDLTELNSVDDLHKPGLDGIGFQDLMVEQMAWWDYGYKPGSGGTLGKVYRSAAGKQTAWINYQTAVDKCFGDFAKQDGYSFMVLNRNYERTTEFGREVKDITTYIDPAKYNYAFAVQDLAAQNFWVQIHSRVVARRKMGAQQIPNL